MKKRIAISLIINAALFASSNIAFADAQSDYQLATQQYRVALANWNATNKADQESYKAALKIWNDAKKSADKARKDIAEKFKIDAEAIKARTSAAVAAASSAKDKKSANAAGKVEMDAAITARNNSLAAIPAIPPQPNKPIPAPEPTPPIKPTPSAKPKPTATDKPKPKPSKLASTKPNKKPKAQ